MKSKFVWVKMLKINWSVFDMSKKKKQEKASE